MSDHETTPTALGNTANLGSQVSDGFGHLTDVGADRIFRDPVHVGDRVVITAAAFELAGGMGFGNGGDNEGNGGGGGGAGGHSEGRPVAVIEVGPDGVTIRPIIDFTRIGITVLIGAFAIWRATKRRH